MEVTQRRTVYLGTHVAEFELVTKIATVDGTFGAEVVAANDTGVDAPDDRVGQIAAHMGMTPRDRHVLWIVQTKGTKRTQ